MTINSNVFDGVAIFTAVVDTGGFSAAAKRLGHSTSHVSKVIAGLETRLGTRLLNRTTRSISLTDEGQLFFERCQIMVDIAEEATDLTSKGQAVPSGKLRINAPVSFGLSHLSHILPRFMDAYPDIQLDIELNDRMVDIVAEGFDMAIRIGRLSDSSLISRKFAQSRGVVVASPSYWDKQGRPAHPKDLTSHQCISYSNLQRPDQWEFVDDNKIFKVKVPIRMLCNSAELEMAMAIAGKGVTRLPAFACTQEIASGVLEPVLENYEAQPLELHAIYPSRTHLSPKVRVFIDFMVNSNQ